MFTLDGGHVDREKDALKKTMEKIRSYLKHNPDAADTIDGVRCWVADAAPAVSTATVQGALEALTALGEIHTEKLPGGKVLYRSARRVSGLQ